MNQDSNYLNKMQLNIKLAYVKEFFHYLSFFLPIWYAFETQFAKPGTLGIIYATSHALTLILELPTGALADLLGRKKTIMIGLLLEGFSWIVISMTKNVSWIWVGYIGTGIAGAFVSGADVALIYDSLKELGKEEKFSEVNAKISLVIRSGIILGTLVGGYVFALKKSLPYLLVGIGVLVAGLLTLFNTEPQIDSEKFSLENYLKQTVLGFKELTKTKHLQWFSLYYFLVGGMSWYFMFFLNLAFITERGFSAIERSWLIAGVYLIASVVVLKIAQGKKVSRRAVYLSLPIIMAAGFLPGYWAGKVISMLSLFLVQFVGISRFSLLDSYANLEFESKYRATALSSLNMLVSLFFVIASITFGKVIEVYGTGTVMTLLGILTVFILIPVTRKLLVAHKLQENISSTF